MKKPSKFILESSRGKKLDAMQEEEDRIRSAYLKREQWGLARLYSWQRQEVQLRIYRRSVVWTRMFEKLGCRSLSGLEILDIGCGNGSWLRQIQEWGADPAKLHGIDFLAKRIDEAKSKAPHIDCQVTSGWSVSYPDNSMDMVTANTVFSSILDPEARSLLAGEMVRVMCPHGTILIYDFRYNNPSNRDVVGIGPKEIRRLFPSMKLYVKTLNLAPPLARRVAPKSPLMSQILEAYFPFLRSHAIYGIRESNPENE